MFISWLAGLCFTTATMTTNVAACNDWWMQAMSDLAGCWTMKLNRSSMAVPPPRKRCSSASPEFRGGHTKPRGRAAVRAPRRPRDLLPYWYASTKTGSAWRWLTVCRLCLVHCVASFPCIHSCNSINSLAARWSRRCNAAATLSSEAENDPCAMSFTAACWIHLTSSLSAF